MNSPDPPPRRRRPILQPRRAVQKKPQPAIFVNTKSSDNLRKGAVELEEIAIYLDRGGFGEDALRCTDLAEDIRNLARSIESKISSYCLSVRELDDNDPPPFNGPRHGI